MSTSVQVPGTLSSSSPNRHQLRQRSPQGQRGRPRKARVPKGLPPPSRLRVLRNQPWFLPVLGGAVLVVLALLYSAIRISAHSSDYSNPITVRPAPPPPPAYRRPSPPSSASSAAEPALPKPSASVNVDVVEEDLRIALDDAVRHALEDAWQLPDRPAEPAADDAETGNGGAQQEAKPRQRTLAELYADLEELGVSPHELQEVVDVAYAERGEKH